MEMFKGRSLWIQLSQDSSLPEIRDYIFSEKGLKSEEYYLLSNGKIVHYDIPLNQRIHIIPRVLGGKGGFGSMLRAIGAQIEKTTNREACRDLSGRRLRDINEEKRLKNWISHQAEREKEAKERKKKKLEKLCEKPKFEFKDEHYDKERQALPEMVEDAVLKGMEAAAASSSSGSTKRKIVEKPAAKKKRKLWMDSELDEDLSSSDEGSDAEEVSKKSESSSSNADSPKQTESETQGERSGRETLANPEKKDPLEDSLEIVATEKSQTEHDMKAAASV